MMRGYLVVTETGATYLGEANYPGVRRLTTLESKAVARAAVGHRPGVYRASDTLRWGIHVITVARRIDPETEATHLETLAARPSWAYHGQGSPGVAGNEQRYLAAQEAARSRKRGAADLAQALRALA